jgi:signal peptidase II
MLARGLLWAAIVTAADQASKAAVRAFFAERACAPHGERVTRFFDLVLTCNRGMSFGLFNNKGGPGAVVFSLFAAVVVVLLLFWLARAKSPLLGLAIGLVIGGAVGNVIDRLRFGGVVDFLYFHIGSWYWPAFNLADSAITIGVAAMLLDGLLFRRAAH